MTICRFVVETHCHICVTIFMHGRFGRVKNSSYLCRRIQYQITMVSKSSNPNPKPLSWWLQVLIAILSALAGMLAETKTQLMGALFNL